MLDVYDILGRKVQRLIEIRQQAGECQVTWEADKFASGFYFTRLISGNQSRSIKLTLIE
ncbi:MAG: T9SS type A sorting domain-containing protein [candidate division Zixibacteria bacterium]|nr:T9SS type A sorting domain-containing protein [candidate division Zixibacteria bacterium]